MAIIETKNLSSLKVKLGCGMDNDGNAIVRSKSFGNLKADASSQDVIDVTNGLVSLQKHALMEVLKQDNTLLSE